MVDVESVVIPLLNSFRKKERYRKIPSRQALIRVAAKSYSISRKARKEIARRLCVEVNYLNKLLSEVSEILNRRDSEEVLRKVIELPEMLTIEEACGVYAIFCCVQKFRIELE